MGVTRRPIGRAHGAGDYHRGMRDAPAGQRVRQPRLPIHALSIILGALAASCTSTASAPASRLSAAGVEPNSPYVVVLGTAQDGGLPQIGCRRECCISARVDPDLRRLVTSILAVDPAHDRRYLLDASPHLPEQVELASDFGAPEATDGRPPLFDGIAITHAHLGHYAGLAYLGREAYGAETTRVYGTPKLIEYLRVNGPWSLLFDAAHLEAREMAVRQEAPDETIALAPGADPDDPGRIQMLAIEVPHRGEFSDTVGFVLLGPDRKLLYIPDIDKWERWSVPIEDWIAAVDYALLDGTFFGPDELPGRPMSEIPHPFIVESMERFGALPAAERAKIFFTHLNHSNPAANPASPESRQVREAGFSILEEGQIFPL